MTQNLGIVILNYYSREDTLVLYESLKAFGHESLNTYILVVDNSCDPHEKQILSENIPPDGLLISSVNDGYAGGNNRGIKHLLKLHEIDYCLILNPDIRLDSEIIPKLISHFHCNKKLAAIGPRLVYRDDPDKIFSDGGMLLFNNGVLNPKQINPGKRKIDVADSASYNVDYIHGACLLISSRALDEVGLIPDHYFMYFEEVDWCRLAKFNGWDIMLDPSVVATQIISERNEKFYFNFTKNHIIFNKKYNSIHWKKTVRIYISECKILLKQKRLKKIGAILLGIVNGSFFGVSALNESFLKEPMS